MKEPPAKNKSMLTCGPEPFHAFIAVPSALREQNAPTELQGFKTRLRI